MLADADTSRATRGGRALLLGAGAAVLATAWIVWTLADHLRHMPTGGSWIDVYVYQWAADAFVSHPGQLYDAAHTQVQSSHTEPAFIYPPAGLLPFLPLVPLATRAGVSVAAGVWTCVDVAALAAALVVTGRRLGMDGRVLGGALLLLAFSGPVLMELDSGQVNGVELLLLVLAWTRLPHPSGGVLLGVAFALKPVAAAFLVVLVVRRQWRATAVVVATVAVLTVPLAVAVGLDGTAYYVTRVGPFMLGHDTQDVANVSLTAVVDTFVGGRALSDHDPRVLAPLASGALAVAILVAVRTALAASVLTVAVRRRLDATRECALLLATIPLTAGTAWLHYYVYVLPLVLVAMSASSRALRRAAWILTPPALWNGLLVQWIYDPYERTDLGSRLLWAKAMLLPLLTLALLGAVVARALRGAQSSGSGPVHAERIAERTVSAPNPRRASAPATRWAVRSSSAFRRLRSFAISRLARAVADSNSASGPMPAVTSSMRSSPTPRARSSARTVARPYPRPVRRSTRDRANAASST